MSIHFYPLMFTKFIYHQKKEKVLYVTLISCNSANMVPQMNKIQLFIELFFIFGIL